jgi:hypothetical protein
VPYHSIASSDDVQDLGQIGQRIDELSRTAADATRIALECHIEMARLALSVQAQHGLKGKRYVEFMMEHGGGSRTDCYDLLLLNEANDAVLEAHDDPRHEYPHWRQVWRGIKDRAKEAEDQHWITPPETLEVVREEIGKKYYDPCPYPLPPGHDALEIEWGDPTYLNAPFIRRHELKGRGLTVFVKKAIEQGQSKTIAVVLPVHRIITMLLEAGASVRSLGRVRWRHAKTGRPTHRPDNCLLFVLRPKRQDGGCE